MGSSFEIICHKTRQRCHIGRGHGGELTEVHIQEERDCARLTAFLIATVGMPLIVQSEHYVDADPVVSAYEEFEP